MAKDNKKSESVFQGNEVMMMLEGMQNGISIIAEEQKNMREEQKSMREEQKSMREDMNKGFRKVDEKFDSVFEFLSRIEDELVDLRKEINILKKTKADKDYVINFDNRIGTLEKKFKTMQAEQANA
ncbi:MAG TPA: hypothetical protein EYG92_10025 [Lutibacter sp.]|nr:hypothetical protein [Lutibacter sp.]